MNLAPLAPLFERRGPWASVYVDASAADHAPTGRSELRSRQICRDLAALGVDDATCRAVRDALDSYREDTTSATGTAGRAVFATRGEVVLDPALTVAPPTEATSRWGPLPHVSPLLALAPEDPVCLVAYIDRIGADFELRTAAGSSPAGRVDGEDWPVHRTATSEWDERHFQLSVENTWDQNARNVADGIRSLAAESGADLLVLVGDDRERHVVCDHLPHPLRGMVVESCHGGRARGSETRLLDDDIAEARHAYAARRTAEELDHFQAARTMSGGRLDAAEGVPALVAAAREHRIAKLFLQPNGPDAHRQVWAGAEPDQIAVRRTETRYLGEPDPFAARADDALIRSAAMAGADAVLVTPVPDGRGDEMGRDATRSGGFRVRGGGAARAGSGASTAGGADESATPDGFGGSGGLGRPGASGAANGYRYAEGDGSEEQPGSTAEQTRREQLERMEQLAPVGGLGALLRWPYETQHPGRELGTNP